jgi:hypothetical protein
VLWREETSLDGTRTQLHFAKIYAWIVTGTLTDRSGSVYCRPRVAKSLRERHPLLQCSLPGARTTWDPHHNHFASCSSASDTPWPSFALLGCCVAPHLRIYSRPFSVPNFLSRHIEYPTVVPSDGFAPWTRYCVRPNSGPIRSGIARQFYPSATPVDDSRCNLPGALTFTQTSRPFLTIASFRTCENRCRRVELASLGHNSGERTAEPG